MAVSARQQLFANALENDLNWLCASTPRVLKYLERGPTTSSNEFRSTKLSCANAIPLPKDITLCRLHMTVLLLLSQTISDQGASFTKINFDYSLDPIVKLKMDLHLLQKAVWCWSILKQLLRRQHPPSPLFSLYYIFFKYSELSK